MKIKFCGITNSEDLQLAEACGADFLGLIIVDSSPRKVTLDQARDLAHQAQFAKTVLVCDYDDSAQIRAAYDFVQPDFIQLHNSGQLLPYLNFPTILAFR